MEHLISIIAIAIAIGGFLFSIKGQRAKTNDDYIKNVERKVEEQGKRIQELEAKVSACEKDRNLLRDYIAKMTRPSKILLVEDDEPTRILFDRLTNKYNREIVVAPNGRTALALFESDDYDLILLDIKLPDIDGIEVFKKMKQTNRKARVVFMSGVCDPEKLIEASKWGNASFVLKPGSAGSNREFMEDLLDFHGVRLKT